MGFPGLGMSCEGPYLLRAFPLVDFFGPTPQKSFPLAGLTQLSYKFKTCVGVLDLISGQKNPQIRSKTPKQVFSMAEAEEAAPPRRRARGV